MIKLSQILACFIFCWAVSEGGVMAETDNPVMPVYYFQRPPSYVTPDNGQPLGFLVDIAKMIFNQAGLSYRLVELPPKRILQEIEQNEYCCSIGWFKNTNREAFAKFSDMIYQSRPTVIVMRRSSALSFPEKPSLQQLMGSQLVLGVISGFSYGAEIDAAISSFNPEIYGISGDSENLLKMIHSERLDYVFMAPEEANYICQKDLLLKSGLRIIEIADEPQGDFRYLMFSKGVRQTVLDRVNAAIQIVQRSDKYAKLVSQAGVLAQ